MGKHFRPIGLSRHCRPASAHVSSELYKQRREQEEDELHNWRDGAQNAPAQLRQSHAAVLLLRFVVSANDAADEPEQQQGQHDGVPGGVQMVRIGAPRLPEAAEVVVDDAAQWDAIVLQFVDCLPFRQLYREASQPPCRQQMKDAMSWAMQSERRRFGDEPL